MVLKKKTVFLSGSVRLPLKIGERAIIFHGGGITLTGTVTAIQRMTDDLIVFETQDATYCVAPKFAAAAALTAGMPICA
jgi:hypothetical protein